MRFLTIGLAAVAAASCAGEHRDHSAGPTACADAPDGAISIVSPWIRTTAAPGAITAAYFVVCNKTGLDVSIEAATSSTASSAELHSTEKTDGGAMRMARVQKIEVPANSEVSLEPGGLHVMMFGVKEQIEAGANVPITISVSGGDAIEVSAVARTAEDAAMSKHDH